MKAFYILIISFLVISSSFAQDKAKVATDKSMGEPTLSVTSHSIKVKGQVINYKVTTGYMLMREEDGKPKANVFFMYYAKEGVTDPRLRPLTYSFNGGYVSSSVWLQPWNYNNVQVGYALFRYRLHNAPFIFG